MYPVVHSTYPAVRPMYSSDPSTTAVAHSTTVVADLDQFLIRVHESGLPVAHPGYQVLSDILFRLGLIANDLTQCSS